MAASPSVSRSSKRSLARSWATAATTSLGPPHDCRVFCNRAALWAWSRRALSGIAASASIATHSSESSAPVKNICTASSRNPCARQVRTTLQQAVLSGGLAPLSWPRSHMKSSRSAPTCSCSACCARRAIAKSCMLSAPVAPALVACDAWNNLSMARPIAPMVLSSGAVIASSNSLVPSCRCIYKGQRNVCWRESRGIPCSRSSSALSTDGMLSDDKFCEATARWGTRSTRSSSLAFRAAAESTSASTSSGESRCPATCSITFTAAAVVTHSRCRFGSSSRSRTRLVLSGPPRATTAAKTKSRSRKSSIPAERRAAASCFTAASTTSLSKHTFSGASCSSAPLASTRSSHSACSRSRRTRVRFIVLPSQRTWNFSLSVRHAVPLSRRCSRWGTPVACSTLALPSRTFHLRSACTVQLSPPRLLILSSRATSAQLQPGLLNSAGKLPLVPRYTTSRVPVHPRSA
mmetsp:Transcript_44652/g.135316  ORF Transcript_44652/g.135316 Transcript_44652/m.135316 type:complete len:463 (+) Transcript_44652:737-2125(+)